MQRAARCGCVEGIALALAELRSPAAGIARRAAGLLAARFEAEEREADVRRMFAACFGPETARATRTASGTGLTTVV
jgi:hypothetical protein